MPLKIIRDDITNVRTDAIVNTANPNVAVGSGVDTAIYDAAGMEKLLKARKEIGPLEPGGAAVTPAFGLSAKYIIHAVGPAWTGGENGESELAARCYERALNLAKEKGCGSVAFPLISAGNYGFPKDEALQIAVSSISKFLLKEDMDVTLVVFDRAAFELSEKIFAGIDEFIDDNYVEKKEVEYERRSGLGMRFTGIFEKIGSSGKTRTVKECKERSADEGRCLHEDRAAMEFQISEDGQCVSIEAERKPSIPHMPEAQSASRMPDVLEESSMSQKTQSPLRDNCSAGMSLDNFLGNVSDTFQERLLHLIDERGLSDVDVYKRANLDRKLFSKIRCNADYKPKKKTAVALAIALELNLKDTEDLLKRAEIAFSPSSKFDLIIEYFINNKMYDIYKINMALFKYDQPILGD